MNDKVQALYDRCANNHPNLAGEQLNNICNLVYLINVYENKFENLMDTDKETDGVQINFSSKDMEKARKDYTTIKIDGPANIEKREKGLVTLNNYLAKNGINNENDDLVIMTERSKKKLDIHKKALNSTLNFYKMTFGKMSHSDKVTLGDAIGIGFHMRTHKKEVANDALNMVKMMNTANESIPTETREMINKGIQNLVELCRNWSLSLAMDQSYYQRLARNLVDRKNLYNKIVKAINDVQSKSNSDNDDMIVRLPPEVTTNLLRCRQLMERDHKNFREWCKTRLKGVLTMATVDDTIKWNIHNVRYLDDRLKQAQEQMKVS